jgi:hypothetical protein
MYKIKSCFSCGKDSFYFGVNRVTEVWIKNLGQAFLKVDQTFIIAWQNRVLNNNYLSF